MIQVYVMFMITNLIEPRMEKLILKNIDWENTLSNKTQERTKIMHMYIWVIVALNQLFKTGSFN